MKRVRLANSNHTDRITTVDCVRCDGITTFVYSDRNFPLLFGTYRTPKKEISVAVLQPLRYAYAIFKYLITLLTEMLLFSVLNLF
jgi:hypothetical protein